MARRLRSIFSNLFVRVLCAVSTMCVLLLPATRAHMLLCSSRGAQLLLVAIRCREEADPAGPKTQQCEEPKTMCRMCMHLVSVGAQFCVVRAATCSRNYWVVPGTALTVGGQGPNLYWGLF
jgi:hypothetical protein